MRYRPLVLLALLARLGALEAQEAAARLVPGWPVAGTVHDSIARAPLHGAIVQLVSAEDLAAFSRSTTSDAHGRFHFADVPGGRYLIGFFHALLDSLGLEPPMREIVVGRRRVRADLAIPSPARMRAAICGPRQPTDSGGVLVGIVRDAGTGRPLTDVTVIVEWTELTLSRGLFVTRAPRRYTMTMANGWYAVCGVPSPGAMMVRAGRGADSTDQIEIHVPAEGFLRRDLYLGSARFVTVRDDSRLGELVPLARREQRGEGQLTGTIVRVVDGKPLEDALVRIVDGPETRTNPRGEFRLADLPLGTRTLLVRAVGYYPAQRSVDVVPGATPLRVELMTFKAFLDTVKVTARRIADRYRGFEDRARSASGRFVRAEEIARWKPVQTSDIFRYIPGVRILQRAHERVAVLRGAVADTALADSTASSGTVCQPMMFLDGMNLFDIPLESLDDLVLPEEIEAIEVYVGGTVPPQYDDARTGCGAIVIWRK